MPDRPLPTDHADLLKRYPGTWARTGWGLMCLLVVVVLPLAFVTGVVGPRWVSVTLDALILVVGAIGLMLLTGVTGQISIGHAAFVAVGAFTAAASSVHLGLPWWLVLPLAGLAAAATGQLVGPFALRLKGLYLAIITLGLLFIVLHVLMRWETVSGGVRGTPVVMWNSFARVEEGAALTARTPGTFGATPIELGTLSFGRAEQLYLLYLGIAFVAALFAHNLLRSRMGRAMAAVGVSDIAAGAIGVRVGRVKVAAFALSAFYAGVAGAMYGWKQAFLTVDPPFNIQMSVEYIAMIFIGGIGTVFGAVAGALLFAFGRPLAEQLAEVPVLASSPLQPGHVSLLVFSVVVVVFVVFEPGGLLGIWLRIKRYFQTWPVPRGGRT